MCVCVCVYVRVTRLANYSNVSRLTVTGISYRFGDWTIPQIEDNCFQHPEDVDRGGANNALCTEHSSITGHLTLDHYSCSQHWNALIWTGGSQCPLPLHLKKSSQKSL